MSTPAEKSGRDPLLAAICHDLRAPLASVTMGAGFVLQSTPDDDTSARQRRILHAMLRSCAQMERLIRNFADLSEIQSNAVELRVGDHDVRETLLLAAERVRPTADARNIDVVVDAPERAVFACDRDRILRALGQLVDNAVHHAPDGSAVTLAASASDGSNGHVVLRVSDAGSGPSEEARANLFAVSGKSRGLAIARGLVEAHGGTARFEPPSTFALTLPRGAPSP